MYEAVTDLDGLLNFQLKHGLLLITECTHTTLPGLYPYLGFEVGLEDIPPITVYMELIKISVIVLTF
jgi:hypothetical protein